MKNITLIETEERDGLRVHTFASSPLGLVANAVLVEGPTECILVDTFFTITDAEELVGAVKSVGKSLKAIYITHAHPDHYGGIPAFHSAFPHTPILAHQGVIDGIMEWPAKVLHWQDIYGGHLYENMVTPVAILEDEISVDGRAFRAIKLPPAETIHATAFALPEQKLFIGGDLLFHKTHLYMGDTCNAPQWLAALNFVKRQGSYNYFIPGHGTINGLQSFYDTAEWLDAFQEFHKPGAHFTEIAMAMYKRFPGYGLANMLWVTRGPGFGTLGASEAGIPPEVMGG